MSGDGRSGLTRLGQRTGRWCWNLFAFLIVTLALVISLVRSLLPQLEQARDYLSETAYQQYGIELQIGELGAQWQHNGPHLLVKGLRLPQQPQLPLALSIEQVELKLDFWGSLWSLSPEFDELLVRGVDIDLTLQGGGTDSDFQWQQLKPLRRLLLEQIEHFDLEDIRLAMTINGRYYDPIHLAHWHWHNQARRHLGQGAVYLDETKKQHELLQLSLELQQLQGERFHGRAYLQAEQLELADWLARHLPLQLQYSGVLNLQAWASFTEQGLLQAQAQLDGSRFSWDQGAQQLQLDSGSLLWRPQAQGWLLSSNGWQFSTNDWTWPTVAMALRQQDEQLSLALDPLPVKGLLPLLSLLPMESSLLQSLASSDANGQLGPLALQKDATGLQAELALTDLGWSQQQALPGLSALTGTVAWRDQRLWFELPQQAITLDWPQQFPEPLTIDELQLQGHWRQQPVGSVLQLSKLELGNRDLSAELQALFQLKPQQTPVMQLAAGVKLHDASQVKHYLPQVMGSSLASYLGDAIQTGHFDDGTVLWHGPLDASPFKGQPGRFLASFTMEQLRFDFLPDWPAADNGMVAARFDNAVMDLQVKSATLADVPINDVSIVIPELGPATVLEIDGAVTAKAEDAKRILQDSFLASSVGTSLDLLQPQQPLPLSLDMTFNIGREVKHLPPVVKGTVSFDNAELFLTPLKLPLERLNGSLQFVNNRIEANEIQGLVLEQPTTISLLGQSLEQGYGIDIDLSSRWDLARLPSYLQNPVTGFMSGQGALYGEVDLLIGSDGFSYTGEVNSELNGVAIKLPEPLAKSAEQNRSLQLRISGDAEQAKVAMQLGQEFAFQGPMQFDQPVLFERYLMQLNPQRLQQPKAPGGVLQWQGDSVALQQWQPLIEAFAVDEQPAVAAELESQQPSKRWFAPLTEVALTAEAINVYDLALGQGSLLAKPSRDGWALQLATDLAQAEIQVGQGEHQLGIAVSADYLQLQAEPSTLELTQQSVPQQQAETMATAQSMAAFSRGVVEVETVLPEETSAGGEDSNPLDDFVAADAADIGKMPALQVEVADLRYGKMQLGPATLLARGEGRNYRIERLQLGPEKHRLQAQGLWLVDGNGSRTRLAGSVSTAKIDTMMARLALPPTIQDATGNMEFELDWQGAPWQLALSRLDGNFGFQLNSGHLKEVPDKGARLLSIFSLESLLRKMALDFSDVFGQGMHFDVFSADVVLDDGVATTSNGRLDGGAGKLKVAGWTNLPERTLDYQLSFSPALASSVPAVMYLSTGTLTLGLGAFAVTKLLEPVIEVITQLRYRLSGSLDDPQLEELERLKREVEVRQGPDPDGNHTELPPQLVPSTDTIAPPQGEGRDAGTSATTE